MAAPKSQGTRDAVIAALLEGQSVSQVAREYKISRQCVMRWRDRAGIDRTPVVQEKLDVIGDMTIDYLREALTTLTFHQTTIFRDPAWLKSQSAEDLAVLHGVAADKAYRLLEAIDAAGQQPEDAGPEVP
jgi:hypothetical protein